MDNMSDFEESSEDEKLLTKSLSKHQKEDLSDSDFEVYGFDRDSEDDDDEKNFENDGQKQDAEIFGDAHFNMPDEKAWGKKKRDYYSADYVDPDYASRNEKGALSAQIEEEEAINVQRKLIKHLDEADFCFDTAIVDDDNEESQKDIENVKVDLKNLSKKQLEDIFEKESPEFKCLVKDFQEHLEELKDSLIPFLNLSKNIEFPKNLINFAKTIQQLTLNYCSNISFYLVLKSNRESVESHPVIKRLAQYRELFLQMKDVKEKLVKQIKKILKANKKNKLSSIGFDNNSIKTLNDNFTSESEQILIEEQNNKSTLSEEDEAEEIAEENESNLVGEDEKRAITYQIAKNKGLTPKRKSELRNPRVKHRNKYRKAKIRRKGAVQEVRKELSRYAGEISGIKASVSKSIKIK